MRQRDRAAPRRDRARRPRRFTWIALGIGAVAVGATLIAADGAPPSRNWGAGLVPSEVPALPEAARSVPTPPVPDAAAPGRRAEIAAEEARLASLRTARVELERQVEALRQEAEQRRRDMPGRKLGQDTAGTGAPAPIQPASGPAAAPPPLPTPPAAPAAAAAPDPAARGVRVFVHHRANSTAASSAAEELAQGLRGAGFEVAAPRPVPFVPSTPVVRYFHEEDQAAAARLAGRLGRGWAIQDFRAFVPQPAPQTLEVWLPGS
jgi:hypothetical protein